LKKDCEISTLGDTRHWWFSVYSVGFPRELLATRFLTTSDKWGLGIIALGALIFLIAWPLTSFTVNWASFDLTYVLVTLFAGLGLACRGLNRGVGMAAASFAIAQMSLYSLVVSLDGYLAFDLHRPLNDEFLAGIDRALGIDWWSYVTWVKSVPYFGSVLTYAYLSSPGQLVVAILVLGFTRRFARLDMLSLAFMISCSVTVAIWAMFPSFGALPLHYSLGLPTPAFDLVMTKEVAMQQLALHAGPLPPLRFEDLTGYVGFPSFHAVMAILTVRALWGLPVSGPLALAANVLVLFSIPADGGHHFIDIAGGVPVALSSIVLAKVILRQAQRGTAKAALIINN
jgi:hypothetical protein